MASPSTEGRYERLELCGQGAMGSVWRARDRRFDRIVAYKQILPDAFGGEEALRRFFEEATALEAIRHPHVVRLLDSGFEGDGQAFLVMDWVDGISLEERLKQGRPPFARALGWALQLCGALEAVHGAGILHRDVKAANVLLTGEGELRVADFGLARREDRRSTLTQAGAILGTPRYISPEALMGKPLGAASDLYSAGILFWELFAGRRPFETEKVSELLAMHLRKPAPSLATVDSSLPPRLVEGVDRCLRKNPDERWASFAVLEELLRSIPLEGGDGGSSKEAARTQVIGHPAGEAEPRQVIGHPTGEAEPRQVIGHPTGEAEPRQVIGHPAGEAEPRQVIGHPTGEAEPRQVIGHPTGEAEPRQVIGHPAGEGEASPVGGRSAEEPASPAADTLIPSKEPSSREGEGAARLLRRPAFAVFLLCLVVLGAWNLLSRGTDDSALRDLELTVEPRGLLLRWRSPSAVEIPWELRRMGRVITRGRSPSGLSHEITVSGLEPRRDYELVLHGGGQVLKRTLSTPSLLRHLPWAVRSRRVLALHLDLRDRSDVALIVEPPGGRAQRREMRLEGTCTMIVAGLPDSSSPWPWKLELDGRVEVEGVLAAKHDEFPSPLEPFVPSPNLYLPKQLEPLADGAWVGDRLLVGDNCGGLDLLRLRRRSPASPTANGDLERLWYFRPPSLGKLEVDLFRKPLRMRTAFVADPSGEAVFLASASGRGALGFGRLDVARRTALWKERMAGEGPTADWLLEDGAWNRCLGSGEWRVVGGEGELPICPAVLADGAVIFALEGSGSSRGQGALRLEWRGIADGRLLARKEWKPAAGQLRSPWWIVSSDLLPMGKRLLFVVAEHHPPGSGARRQRRAWLMSSPLDPTDPAGLEPLAGLDVLHRWQRLTPDGADRLWIPCLGGFKLWRASSPQFLEEPELPMPLTKARGMVEGLGGVYTRGPWRYAVANHFLDTVPDQTVAILLRWRSDAPQMASALLERSAGSQGFRFPVWTGRAIGTVDGDCLTVYDTVEGRAAKLYGIRALVTALPRPDGILAMVWKSGRITLDSLPAAVASDRRRVEWR